MADTTLAELLRPRTKEEEIAALLSTFQEFEFPITDWEVGGAARTYTEAIARELADLTDLIPRITAGGHVLLAAAMKLASGVEDQRFLDLLARHFFNLERARATFTQQRCVVTCELGSGPQTVNPGFIVRNPKTGRRYLYNGAPVVVPDGDSAEVFVDAENPGAKWNDQANTITEIVTPLPGLSVTNPPVDFGGLDSVGAAKKSAQNRGTGTVTPSGAPQIRRQYTITVIASGSAGSTGTVKVSWIRNGVTTTNTISPIPETYTGAGDNVTLTFDDGAGVGWMAGDRHTFATPGTPIVRQGVDDETNARLAQRCLGRWPSLGLNIVAEKYVAWIQQCSLDNGFGIEKWSVRPSATVAGQTDIVVATASGAPSGGTISALQDYVNARDGITDTAELSGAVDLDITIGGAVSVRSNEAAAVKARADELWAAYINALDIGGDKRTGYPGVVRLAEFEEALMAAGAIDVSDLQLNGMAANRTMLFNEVAVVPAGMEPSAALMWVTVA